MLRTLLSLCGQRFKHLAAALQAGTCAHAVLNASLFQYVLLFNPCGISSRTP